MTFHSTHDIYMTCHSTHDIYMTCLSTHDIYMTCLSTHDIYMTCLSTHDIYMTGLSTHDIYMTGLSTHGICMMRLSTHDICSANHGLVLGKCRHPTSRQRLHWRESFLKKCVTLTQISMLWIRQCFDDFQSGWGGVRQKSSLALFKQKYGVALKTAA